MVCFLNYTFLSFDVALSGKRGTIGTSSTGTTISCSSFIFFISIILLFSFCIIIGWWISSSRWILGCGFFRFGFCHFSIRLWIPTGCWLSSICSSLLLSRSINGILHCLIFILHTLLEKEVSCHFLVLITSKECLSCTML